MSARRFPPGGRGALRVGAVFAVVAVVVCGGRVPAWGVEEITTQAYVGVLGVDNAVARGLTGKGVRIGVIDGPVDTSLPELADADVTVKQMCDFTTSDVNRSHGSAVVSILAARGYGLARDAQIINYALPDYGDDTSECQGRGFLDQSIGAAVADGVQLISISLGGLTNSDSLREAVAGAVARGVVVVVGTGNYGSKDPPGSLASMNGTVGVGASDLGGRISAYSNYGRGLTVLAPVEDFQYHDLGSGQVVTGRGTSFAAPIVAGMIAVAMQVWPGASGAQVAQSVVGTATLGPTGQALVNFPGLIDTDPSGFADESPVMDKFPGEEPSWETVADYRDGLLGTESVFDNDPSYVYRGVLENVARGHADRSALGTSPRYHRRE